MDVSIAGEGTVACVVKRVGNHGTEEQFANAQCVTLIGTHEPDVATGQPNASRAQCNGGGVRFQRWRCSDSPNLKSLLISSIV